MYIVYIYEFIWVKLMTHAGAQELTCCRCCSCLIREDCRTAGLEPTEGMGAPEWELWPLLRARPVGPQQSDRRQEDKGTCDGYLGVPAHCGVFRSILASANRCQWHFSPLWQLELSPDIANVPWGGKMPLLRTTILAYNAIYWFVYRLLPTTKIQAPQGMSDT